MGNAEYSVRVRIPNDEFGATRARDNAVELLDRLVRELGVLGIEADWSPLA
jgi:hypothetical protein